MKFLKRYPPIVEIAQYTRDLQIMTKMRIDPSITKEEKERYDTIIKCMQLVVIKLNGGKS